MRAVLQRVRRGSVTVEDRAVSVIGPGLVILLGVGVGDTPAQADWMAEKVATLRVFEDPDGKTNLSIQDVKGSALVVSQFTLYADTRKGRRPSFLGAALPAAAAPLVEHFAAGLARHGVPVERGAFGAHMVVEIENDGPLTIWLERTQGAAAA
ncbi:MAG: D-aminoacyl-tRNA deacylase [Anaerolineales bacterium]